MTTRQGCSLLLAVILAMFVLLMMASCGVNYHLRKAERHIRKAEALGGKWSSDTLFKKLSFKVPGIKVEFEPKILTSGQPMIFEKDGVVTEVLITPPDKPGEEPKVAVKTDCPPQTVTQKVPVAINNSIKAGRSLFADICIWLLIALCGFTAGYWARDGPKIKLLVENMMTKKPPV